MITFSARHRQGEFLLDAEFRMEAGVTALFGPSGSGKSTVIRIVAGLTRPDAGRIDIDGQVLMDSASGTYVKSHKRRMGVVFQDAALFPHLSVLNNLQFSRLFRRSDVRLPLDQVVETLGIGALLARRPSTLSGGERQRVAIGRALLSAPRLLLMDEPLAALDSARKAEILPLIERIARDFAVPILYVSHAVDEVARLAQHVVMLEAGRVVASGTPQAVLSAPRGGDDRFAITSVIAATIGSHEAGLTSLHHPAGALWLNGRIGSVGDHVRVVLRATDIVLSLKPPEGLSIRTALIARVSAVRTTGGALAEIELTLRGGDRITSVVTQKAMTDLGLVPELDLFALVRTVALDERMIAASNSSLPHVDGEI